MNSSIMTIFTLSELLAAAHAALQDGYAGPADRRAGRLPNRRAFRFYAARRLIDPPAAMRGRVGLYALHHLHQLLAIKRLQATGSSLEEIGLTLASLDAEALAVAAGPPAEQRRASRAASSPARTLSEMDLDLGLGMTLRLDPPLRASRSLKRRLRSASRALARAVRAERRREDSNKSKGERS